MKSIVITGSTRGIGYGLAESFLRKDCRVVVSGRSPASIEKAVNSLKAKYPPELIFGYPCDVTQFDQVQALWDAAKSHFSNIDIWINNAGMGHSQQAFWELDPVEIKQVLETNLLGTMYGSKIAIQGMMEQGYGAIYNLEGLGSGSQPKVKGLSLYGTTKAGIRYLNDSLAIEAKGTPVIIGMLQPGMVATEMLSRQYEGRPEDWEKAKKIFNILADRVETVTPWLAQKILSNTKNGVRISWSSNWKIFWRFLMAPIQKRQIFD